jgi:hypothetical protein
MFYKTLEEKMCSLQYFCGGEDVFTPVFLVRRRCVHPSIFVEKMCSLQYFCGGEDVFTPVILVRRRCVHPSIFVEEKMCSPQYF